MYPQTEAKTFSPLTSSADAVNLFSSLQPKISKAQRKLDYWDHIFIEAAEIVERAKSGASDLSCQQDQALKQLLKMLIGRDEKVFHLAYRYLSIDDLLQIKSRLVGSGLIGGKAGKKIWNLTIRSTLVRMFIIPFWLKMAVGNCAKNK